MKQVPNGLGLLRIILTAVVMVLIVETDATVIAAAVFSLAALTDFFDGWTARRFKVTSVGGAFLDLIADKILIGGVLFALVAVDHIWVWAAAIMVIRELAILGLRSLVALQNETIAPSWTGKTKMTVQSVTIVLTILWWANPITYAVIMLALVLTIVSGLQYFLKARVLFRTI